MAFDRQAYEVGLRRMSAEELARLYDEMQFEFPVSDDPTSVREFYERRRALAGVMREKGLSVPDEPTGSAPSSVPGEPSRPQQAPSFTERQPPPVPQSGTPGPPPPVPQLPTPPLPQQNVGRDTPAFQAPQLPTPQLAQSAGGPPFPPPQLPTPTLPTGGPPFPPPQLPTPPLPPPGGGPTTQAAGGDQSDLIRSFLYKSGGRHFLSEAGGGGAGGALAAGLENLKNQLKGAGEALAAPARMLGQQRLGGIVSEAGHGVEGVGKTMPLGQGKGLEYVGKFVSFLGDGTDKLQDFVKGLHASNVQFAEFSAGMSRVHADQFQRDVQLQQQRGDNRAESAERLAQGMHKLNTQFARVEDRWGQMANNLFGRMAENFANGFLQPLLDKLGLAALGEPEGAGESMGEFLMNSTDTEKYGDPGRFGRPARFEVM